MTSPAVIIDAGFGDAILHRTGHSLGTTGHFNGVNIDNLETQDRRQLIPGVMYTIEPGIYLPNFNFDNTSPKASASAEINCLARRSGGSDNLPPQTAFAFVDIVTIAEKLEVCYNSDSKNLSVNIRQLHQIWLVGISELTFWSACLNRL